MTNEAGSVLDIVAAVVILLAGAFGGWMAHGWTLQAEREELTQTLAVAIAAAEAEAERLAERVREIDPAFVVWTTPNTGLRCYWSPPNEGER